MKIRPDPIVAEPGKDVTIHTSTGGAPPKDARYAWDFGDGSKEVTVKNDSTVVHKFAKKGDYTVTVKLYDNTNGLLLGKVSAAANIMEGMLGDLQKCDAVSLRLDADIISNSVQMSYEGIFLWSHYTLGSTVTGR